MPVVLRDEQRIFLRRGIDFYGNGIRERIARNQRAASVNAGLANRTVERFRIFERVRDKRIGGIFRIAQLRTFLERRLHRNFRTRGNELCERVRVFQRQIEHARNVLDRHSRRHASERDDVRDVIFPVFLRNPFQHFPATDVVEIDIDIRHRNSVGIEKTFEQQIVFHRVNSRDSEAVCDDASRRAPAPGTDENAHLARRRDEILHDEKVARETHRFDCGQLKIDAFPHVLRNRFAPAPMRSRERQMPQVVGLETNAINFFRAAERVVAIAEFGAQFFFGNAFPQLRFRAERFRNREHRHNRRRIQLIFFDLVCDLERVQQNFRAVVKKRFHLRRRFEPFLPRVAQAIFVGQLFAGIETEQNVVRRRVFFVEKMHVVCRHDFDSEFFRDAKNSFFYDDLPFINVARIFANVVRMAHDFEVKIFAENTLKPTRRFLRTRFVARENFRGNFARDARRAHDQTFVVALENFFVDARTVVITLRPTERTQLHEIAIAGQIFREQNQVISRAVDFFVRSRGNVLPFVKTRAPRHVSFTTENRFNLRFSAGIVEKFDAEHVPVISQRDRRHAVGFRFGGKLFYVCRAVQQRILRVHVQVHEIAERSGGNVVFGFGHFFCASFFSASKF